MSHYDKLPNALKTAYHENANFRRVVEHADIRYWSYENMLEMACEFLIEENKILNENIGKLHSLGLPPIVIVTTEEHRRKILEKYKKGD